MLRAVWGFSFLHVVKSSLREERCYSMSLKKELLSRKERGQEDLGNSQSIHIVNDKKACLESILRIWLNNVC